MSLSLPLPGCVGAECDGLCPGPRSLLLGFEDGRALHCQLGSVVRWHVKLGLQGEGAGETGALVCAMLEVCRARIGAPTCLYTNSKSPTSQFLSQRLSRTTASDIESKLLSASASVLCVSVLCECRSGVCHLSACPPALPCRVPV